LSKSYSKSSSCDNIVFTIKLFGNLMLKKICGGIALAAALALNPVQAADFKFDFGAAFYLDEEQGVPKYLVQGSFIFSAQEYGAVWNSVRNAEVFINGRRLDIGDLSVELQQHTTYFGLMSVASATVPGQEFFGMSVFPWGDILAVGVNVPSLQLSDGTTLAHGGITPLIEVSPVPEPSSLAMMLGGLCAIGAMARRRRKL